MKMGACPFCSKDLAEHARVCRHCGAAIVKRCPFCAEEVPVQAQKCAYCASDLLGRTPSAAAMPTLMSAPRVPMGPVGDRRDILLSVILMFVTCGIYGIYQLYKIGDELNQHAGAGLNPGLDILLTFLTCGLWAIYVHYRYASALKELTEREGVPVVDLVVPAVVLTVFGFAWVSMILMQNELNHHWERHA